MVSEITYASVTDLLANWHNDRGAEFLGMSQYSLSTALPDKYKTRLPFIRVSRIGGPREYGIDRAQVRAEVLASSYGAAEALANKLDACVESGMNGFSDGIGRVMLTEVRQGAVFAPWDDPQVTRFMSTYLIQVGA